MGALKTFLWFCCAVALTALPARAFPEDAPGRALLFAACAGRYSATMEHAWLTGGDGAEARQHRQQFVDLVEALQPLAVAQGLSGPAILDARITAKFAQARLLQRATFDTDATLQRRARIAAQRAMAPCAALLLA